MGRVSLVQGWNGRGMGEKMAPVTEESRGDFGADAQKRLLSHLAGRQVALALELVEGIRGQ